MGISNNDLTVDIKKHAKDLEAKKPNFNFKLNHLNSKVDRFKAQIDAKFAELMTTI